MDETAAEEIVVDVDDEQAPDAEPDDDDGLWSPTYDEIRAMARSMFRLWIAIVVVESVAFAVLVYEHAWQPTAMIPFTIGFMSFFQGRSYERWRRRGKVG